MVQICREKERERDRQTDKVDREKERKHSEPLGYTQFSGS